jgi:hypothetical protein
LSVAATSHTSRAVPLIVRWIIRIYRGFQTSAMERIWTAIATE